jgi:TrmH family RNA methyltransferase
LVGYAITGLSLARVREITSKDNPAIKELRALATDARGLRARQRTLLDGPHLIEAYRHHRGIPEMLVLSESGRNNAEATRLIAAYPEVDVLHLPDSLFREISGVATPVGILAVIGIPEAGDAPIDGSCVMLDAVQDGGNIGAILRTAAAAGVRDVLLGRGCAGAWLPKVLRAAQGAHFGLRIREQVDIAGLLRQYTGISVATVARDGTPLFELSLAGNIAWLFGNEGAGVAADLIALAGQRATIPIAADTESLNVAAAAAICLFEQVRQRRLAGETRNA